MFGKIALGAAALTTAASGGIAATQGGDVSAMMEGHPRMEARHAMHEDIHAAIETNDFDAWVSAVTSDTKNPMAAFVSEDVFAQMVEIHALMEAGDRDAAMEARAALHTELGLPERPKRGAEEGRMRRGMKPHMMLDADTRASLDQALADENFDAWATILIEAGAPEERVTEDHFERMVTHYEMRQERASAS